MTATPAKQSSTTRIFDTIEQVEQASLTAARKFVDTIDGAIPAIGDDGPRRKIIDSAFKMTEQLVSASTRIAQNIVDATEKALT